MLTPASPRKGDSLPGDSPRGCPLRRGSPRPWGSSGMEAERGAFIRPWSQPPPRQAPGRWQNPPSPRRGNQRRAHLGAAAGDTGVPRCAGRGSRGFLLARWFYGAGRFVLEIPCTPEGKALTQRQTEHAAAGETKPPFMLCSCCLSLINKCFSLQWLPGGVALSSKKVPVWVYFRG